MNKLDIRQILCSVDFSPESGSALVVAAALARARHAKLRALHVVDTRVISPGPMCAVERERVMGRLRSLLIKSHLGDAQIVPAVRTGDPAMELLRFARSTRTDLIVIGGRGAAPLEAGDDPVTPIVMRSECPVLVTTADCPAPRREGYFSRIVCGVEPLPSSVPVVRQALLLAWETGGRVTCVHAGPTQLAAGARSDVRERIVGAMPRDITETCELDVVLTEGHPGVEILRVAEHVGADLIAIGPPRHWTSTAQTVLNWSSRPVMVMPDARPLRCRAPHHGHLAAGLGVRSARSRVGARSV